MKSVAPHGFIFGMYNYGWVERGYLLTAALQMIVPPIGMLSLHSEDLTRLLFNKYYNCSFLKMVSAYVPYEWYIWRTLSLVILEEKQISLFVIRIN